MKKYKDTCLKNFLGDPRIRTMINKEHERQLNKWGVQNRTLPEWMLYISEEHGEMAEAISEFIYRGGSEYDIMKEAIEMITLGIKVVDMLLEEFDTQ